MFCYSERNYLSGSEIDFNERNEDPSLKPLSGARSRKGDKVMKSVFEGPHIQRLVKTQ